MLLMPVMGGKFYWLVYITGKWMGTVQRRENSTKLLRCFWCECRCVPNRYKHIGNIGETLLSRYEETQARLQKMRYAVYNVISIWGVRLENSCVTVQTYKMNYLRIPNKYSRCLVRGSKKATKTTTESSEGRNRIWGCNQSVPLHL